MALSAEAGSAVGYLQGASALGFIAVRLRGDPAAALKELGRALRRYPLDSIPPADRPYVLLATMYALAGRPDRARTLLTELERVVPPAERRGWREAYRRGAWGYVAMAEGRLQDAVPDLRAWARGAGGGCMTCGLPELARVYEQLGQTDSAVTIYERYVTMPDLWRHEIDPGELQGAFLRLGELYERLGEREKASEYYSRFIELWKDCDPELRPRVADARRRLAALMEG
jgi:tetratricopeptide (TPR) repeat protein